MTPIKHGEEPLIIVIGPSKCGKTTLCFWLVAQMWRLHGLRSIVFDPFARKHNWGPTAWVTSDLERFKRAVSNSKGCAIFWDESTTTVKKNDSEDIAFFTNLRHNHDAFVLIGHDFTVVSPMMRANLSEAYVFRQAENRPQQWAGLFADDDMLQTAELGHREFIHKTAFRPIVRRSMTVAELASIPRQPVVKK